METGKTLSRFVCSLGYSNLLHPEEAPLHCVLILIHNFIKCCVGLGADVLCGCGYLLLLGAPTNVNTSFVILFQGTKKNVFLLFFAFLSEQYEL